MTLAELIGSRVEEILARWTAVLAEVLPSASASPVELRDELPRFLASLSTALALSEPRAAEETLRLAREHGRQRLRLHFSLATVVREYGLLRRVIRQLAREAGLAVSFGEEDRLLAAFDEALSQAATQYSVENVEAGRKTLQQALQVSGAGTWELGVKSGTVTADEAFRSMAGLAPTGELILEDVLAWIHLDDRARVGAALGEALSGYEDGSCAAEYRTLPMLDGSHRWLSTRGQVFFDGEGHATRLLATVLDVTQRKVSESARDNLLASMANQSVFGVAVLQGEDLRFQMANDVFRRSVGDRDVVGKPLLVAVPELNGQGVEQALREIRDTRRASTRRESSYQLLHQGDGRLEERFFDSSWQPVLGSEGDVSAILIINHDVTDAVRLRQREHQLALAQRERAAFEQQLIGIVSHDLRNPLSSIVVGTTLLGTDAALTPRSAKTVLRIQSSVQRAVRMVKDLLDFTQVRVGGGIKVAPVPMDLRVALEGWVEELQTVHPERDIRLRVQGETRGSWDEDRLAQVAQNLISNAVKYSPTDTPVDVSLEGDGEDVELRVHNLGPPIPAAALPLLFLPMERGASPAGNSERSIGLGLFIVKHVVEAHAGTVVLHGSEGSEEQGTTFVVRLPRSLPS